MRALRVLKCTLALTVVAVLVISGAFLAKAAAPKLAVDLLSSSPIHKNVATRVVMRLSVDGTCLAQGVPVALSVLSGDARFAQDLRSQRVLVGTNGKVSTELMARSVNDPVELQVDAGDQGTAVVRLAMATVLRQPIVVGFATGGIGAVPGPIEIPDDGPNGWRSRRGATTIYGTGDIARNTRLTFAYDSADALQQSELTGPYVENPNDRPFPIYGDTSIRRDDALSLDRVYARVENGRSSALWGEFYANAGGGDTIGGYSILLNGGKIHSEGNRLSLDGFTARDSIAYDRRLLSPTGLGIGSQILKPNIVVGSDTVTLDALDRRTGAVISQRTLVRGSDYVLDYASGLLQFTNPILPYDPSFNPQVVVVQYEYGNGGAGTNMSGLQGRFALSSSSAANVWYLNDAYGGGNFKLVGESFNAGSPHLNVSVSHERSVGVDPSAYVTYGNVGDAYRVSVQARGSRASFSTTYTQTSQGYQNTFGGYATPGLSSITAKAGLTLSSISALSAQYLYAKNRLPSVGDTGAIDNDDAHASLTLHVQPNKRLKYDVGVADDAAESNGTVNPSPLPIDPTLPADQYQGAFYAPMVPLALYQPGSGKAIQGEVGASWAFTQRATIALDRVFNLGSEQVDPYSPPQTTAEFDFSVSPTSKVYVRQLWKDFSTPTFAASQASAAFAATAKSQTMFGFEQSAGDALFDYGYSVDHTEAGTDLFDAIGAREKVAISDRLSGNAFMQVGQALYSTQLAITNPYFWVAGTSLDYSYKTFHATGQVQFRTGFDSGSTVSLGAAGPISPAVSLFGSYMGAYTAGVTDSEVRGGLSYRPSRNDRYVTLASIDTVQSNLTNYNAYVSNVAQIQELYRSSTRTEWAGSIAYKLTGDAFFAPRTTILGLRTDQGIGSRTDIGIEGHWSDIAPLDATRAAGLAAELGYRVGASLRVAGGYTFSGYADPTAAVNPTHKGFYLTVTSYVDRIFGWGKDAK